MDTNLLTIDNMLFTGATILQTPPAPSANTTYFSKAPNSACISESIKTDNISTITQKKSIIKQREDFNQTLRKTIKPESTHQNQNNIKPKKQYPISDFQSKVSPDKFTSTQEIPINLEALMKENSIKMAQKNGSQLTQLIANLKDGKSKPVTEQDAKSTEIKLRATTYKDQLGIKTVPSDKSGDQSVLKTVLKGFVSDEQKLRTSLSNISKGITNTQSQKTKNSNDVSASNGTVVAKKVSFKHENTQYDKAGTNEKATILDTSVVVDRAKSIVQNGQKNDHTTLVDDNAKTRRPDKNMTDKSIIQTNEKTSILNTNFSEVQNKITPQDSHEIIHEKSTPNAKITADGKTTNPEIISDSSNNNNKEIPISGNKLSDDATVRDLNIADVQIIINQTKKHNSSTYNNSNSDSEQMPPHNNPVNSVTVLSYNSAEGTKNVELTAQNSPNNISAEVGKQILESIHNSFSQEGRNQQITVQLNPPELGKVFIKFQEQDNHITGMLEVSKTQTRIEIEQAIPQIVRSLQDSGIQIKRLDVTLSQGEQPEQGALREQTLQNGWAQQQDSADSYEGGNNPDAGEINEWLINNKNYRNSSELHESLTDNGSINMLI
jgi:flagellar hook-length control protein FliK